MDYLQKYTRQFRSRLLMLFLLNNALLVAAWLLVGNYVGFHALWLGITLLLVPIIALLVVPWLGTVLLVAPVKALWQAILHVAPRTEENVPAPKPADLQFGRELVTNLTAQIYQLASVVDKVEQTDQQSAQDLHRNFVASNLPLPLLVLNKDASIVYANDTAAKYLRRELDEIVGQNVYTLLDLSFASDDTLDKWLTQVRQNSVTASRTWERVRIGLADQTSSLQFDLAAYYNKGNPSGYEMMLVLFDHTHTYSQDDQAVSFVALAVHELRTPLTLLRGYIEVFDEELGNRLTPELKDFMGKMNASAETLAGFVDNILNVARIDDNQLTLQLHEEQWPAIVESVVKDMSLRAHVRGITLKTDIAPNLPTVGVDRYSIYEVMANLIDNAVKYSTTSKEVFITSALNANGLIETSVKDFGLGIDTSVLPHIFDKFYRSHRNRAQIGGTGLGLYISKAIVDAHGGQIWVSSKVDEGSNFSFTVQPYSAIAAEKKDGTGGDIVRSAHGWIKNHSLYRG